MMFSASSGLGIWGSRMMVRMKVEHVFSVGKLTVFSGALETDVAFVRGVECELEIDGERVAQLVIEGEVLTGRPFRDLWTSAEVRLDPGTIRDREVWLKSL